MNQLSAFLYSQQQGKMILFHLFIFESHDQTDHTHFLTMPTQNIFDQILIFVITYQHAKNQFIPSVHSSDTVSFRVPSPHPFFTMSTPKIFYHLLICVKLYEDAKNQFVPPVLSWDTVNFRVQNPDWPHSIFGQVPSKTFQSTFNFCEFVSTRKKRSCFINLFWRNTWFENPVIWMAESVLAYTSETTFFLKEKICIGTLQII